MKTCWISLLSLVLAGSLPAGRARADGYTFEQAVAALQKAHPLLSAARASLGAAEGDAIDAGLWTNPILSGSWTRGIKDNSYAQSGYATWGIAQFLELSNAPGARRRSAQLEVAATRADFAAVLAGLVLDLEDAFIARASADESARVLQTLVTGLQDVERVIEDRVQAGAAPRYDAARIAISVATAAADLASAQADRMQAEGQLRAAIGPGVTALAGEPHYDLYAAPDLPPLAAVLQRLRASRPDLLALRERARSADAAITASSREVFPGVQLSVGGGFGSTPGQVDLGVGLALPIPVVDSGQGSVRASRARAAAARANEAALQSPAELALASAHAAATQRRAALAAFQGVLSSVSDQMLEEARAGYLAARFSVLELADAYLALRDARLRAIELANAARSAEVGLGRLVGSSLRTRGTP